MKRAAGETLLEIHEIRYFLAVCETMNFSRAAERCNVSQPSLTRAIQSLEGKLGGGPVINRERGNTHLTELGRLMQPYFQRMLENMEAAVSTARTLSVLGAGTLKLGLMCTIGPAKMIGLFEGLSRAYPNMQLILKDGAASILQEQLASGQLDAAIFCQPEVLDDRFHVLPLYSERFVVAFPPDHPWREREAITLAELHQQPYLARVNCEYNDHIDALMARAGIEPLFPYESERDDWIQAMVMAGLGCTTIPEYAVTQPGLPWRPLIEPTVSRTINLVSVRGRPHGQAIGALVMAVKRHAWVPKSKVTAAV